MGTLILITLFTFTVVSYQLLISIAIEKNLFYQKDGKGVTVDDERMDPILSHTADSASASLPAIISKE